MRNLILSVLLLSSSQTATAQTNTLLLQESIELAVHQEMLTQCIAKSYLCTSLDVQKTTQETLLKQSVQLFEHQLEQLSTQSYNSPIRAQLNQIKQLWTGYKFICEGTYNARNASVVLEYNSEIWNACHRLTRLLQQHANNHLDYQEQTVYALNPTLLAKKRTFFLQRMTLYALANQYQLGDAVKNKAAYTQAAASLSTLLEKHAGVNNTTFIPSMLTALATGERVADKAQKLLPHILAADAYIFALDELVSQQEPLQVD